MIFKICNWIKIYDTLDNIAKMEKNTRSVPTVMNK